MDVIQEYKSVQFKYGELKKLTAVIEEFIDLDAYKGIIDDSKTHKRLNKTLELLQQEERYLKLHAIKLYSILK